MMEFFVVLDGNAPRESDDRELSFLREAFARVFPKTDTSFGRIDSGPMYRCKTYLEWTGWREFLDGLRTVRGNLMERETVVTHFIFAAEVPREMMVDNERGFWFDARFIETIFSVRDNRELFKLFHSAPAKSRGRWVVLPFADESDDDRNLFEESHPNGSAAVFGRVVNIPARFALPRAGLRVRTVSGTRLDDYIRSTYAGVLPEEEPMIGGRNIIATTLFQMNDRLELVNYVTEKRKKQENLNLFSLSAMQMESVDARDDTNIAVLVRRGEIRVRKVLLGE